MSTDAQIKEYTLIYDAERVIADADKYANFHSFLPSFLPSIYRLYAFFSNSDDQYIRLVHIFCPFQMRWVMITWLTHWDGIGGKGGLGVDTEGGGRGWSVKKKKGRRGEGPKVVSYHELALRSPWFYSFSN